MTDAGAPLDWAVTCPRLLPKPLVDARRHIKKVRCVCIGLFVHQGFVFANKKLWAKGDGVREEGKETFLENFLSPFPKNHSPFFKPFATIAPLAKAQWML